MTDRLGGGASSFIKIAFFAGLVVLGAVAMFLGVVFLIATGSDGPIMISYVDEGKTVMETVTKSENPGRFWQLYAMMGVAPLLLGAIATLFGVRWFRS